MEQFQIRFPQADIDDLRQRLQATRWPDEARGSPWHHGVPLAYMKSFVSYWLNTYDWREQEEILNLRPHFRTRVGQQNIHFMRSEGCGPSPMPLLLIHGWPGSFAQLNKVVSLLADPGAHGGHSEDAFTVIVPSLPGFGFSSPDRPASIFEVADLLAELMSQLGYERFGVQGGDWGSIISSVIALRHPHRVLGLHLHEVSADCRPANAGPHDLVDAEERDFLDRLSLWAEEEGAFAALQATKPQTLSYALTDSPVGLAAWFIEKFRNWSDCHGEPDEVLSKDEMITAIMLYWLTNTTHSALRLYNQTRARTLQLGPNERIDAPCGIVRLPKGRPLPPKRWIERVYNIVRWSTLPEGGYFASWEAPVQFAHDIQAFFRPLRGPSAGGALGALASGATARGVEGGAIGRGGA